jgi:hypothetical protein
MTRTIEAFAVFHRQKESRVQAAAGDLQFGPRGRFIVGTTVASLVGLVASQEAPVRNNWRVSPPSHVRNL